MAVLESLPVDRSEQLRPPPFLFQKQHRMLSGNFYFQPIIALH